MKLIKKFRSKVFDIKYKLGIAKEGKDFYTCGQYFFCEECTPDDHICVTDTIPVSKPKFGTYRRY